MSGSEGGGGREGRGMCDSEVSGGGRSGKRESQGEMGCSRARGTEVDEHKAVEDTTLIVSRQLYVLMKYALMSICRYIY